MSDADEIDLEGYTIERAIGSGAFSTVYLATQESTGQKVAVKVLKLDPEEDSAKNEKRTTRFRREMKLSGGLQHPSIVRVMDYSENGKDRFYTVFEYVPGRTLRQLIKDEGALSLERTRNIMLQVLDAIASAHDQGVIHRDLKPENLMVHSFGAADSVKILDFGISTLSVEQREHHTRVTVTHEYLGTPAYSAPEQLRGDDVTEKSDLYAWCLIFLECLTGELPYKEEHPALIVQRQLSPAPVPLPPSLMNSRLGWLLTWGLQKDAARRVGNARQLYKRLSKIEMSSIPHEGDYLKTEPTHMSMETLTEIKSEQHSQRQITAIACDIYFEASSPEPKKAELHDLVMSDLLSAVAYRFTELGGFVVEPFVDRIVVLFGYPEVYESDTRRAAAAALELRTFLVQRNHFFKANYGIAVVFKMGIHTGDVVFRDQDGSRAAPKGITLNTAGRLCSVSDPGKIIVSEASANSLSNAFDLRKPDSEQSDFSGGNAAFLNSAKHVQGLHEIQQTGSSAFIGREREWAQLSVQLSKSRKKGQGALLVGEAGIGKSRLIEELAFQAVSQERPIFEMAAFPEHSSNPLFPFLELLKNALKLERFSTEVERDDFVCKLIEPSSLEANHYLPLLYRWLGMTSTHFPPPEHVSPPKQKMLFMGMTVDFLTECILEPGAVVIFEDVHWIDPSSLELLKLFIAKLEMHSVFLVMTTRPTFTAPWDSKAVTHIELKALEESDVRQIFEQCLGSIHLSARQYEQVLSRIDGNPLFAVELACSIRSKLGESLPHETVVDSIGKSLDIEVPDTLKGLLASRLEQMGSAKQTAQLASVIGRRFEFDLLAKISTKDDGTLLADLEQLMAARLLYAVHQSDELEYVFHHVLVRDHAYESLSRSEACRIHRELATTLEAIHPEACQSEPELLARHWSGAEEYSKASGYGLLSTSNALMNSSFEEAILYGTECMEWLREIDMPEKELQACQLTVNAYVAARGASFPKVEQIYKRTDELVSSLPTESPVAYALLLGKILHYHSMPDYKKSKALWDQAMPIARHLERHSDLAVLYAFEAHRLSSHGQFEGMLEYFDLCLDAYEKCEGVDFPTQYSFNPKVISQGVKANYFMISGRVMEARRLISESIAYSRSINDAHSIGIALGQEVFLECATGERGRILELLPAAKAHMEEYGLALWGQMLMILEGWAMLDLSYAQMGLDMLHAIGYKPFALFWHSLLAEIEFEAGNVDEALERLNKLLEEDNLDELTCLPPVYRIKGLCHAQLGETQLMDTAFSEGMALTEKLGAHLLTVRMALDWLKFSEDSGTHTFCFKHLAEKAHLFKQTSELEIAQELQMALGR